LLMAALVWLVRPFGMSGWFTPGSPAPSTSSQVHQPPPVAEKMAHGTSSPPPPGQPEGTKATEVVQEEKVMPPAVTLAAAPLVPPSPAPAISAKMAKPPMDYLGPMKAKLKEQGFSGIQTSLDEKGQLIISGQVKSGAQRDEVMSLAKSIDFPGAVNFDQLTVVKRVVEKPVRRTVARENREPREIPAPPPPMVSPMKPLGPKLD